jgi:hypothetical protein
VRFPFSPGVERRSRKRNETLPMVVAASSRNPEKPRRLNDSETFSDEEEKLAFRLRQEIGDPIEKLPGLEGVLLLRRRRLGDVVESDPLVRRHPAPLPAITKDVIPHDRRKPGSGERESRASHPEKPQADVLCDVLRIRRMQARGDTECDDARTDFSNVRG